MRQIYTNDKTGLTIDVDTSDRLLDVKLFQLVADAFPDIDPWNAFSTDIDLDQIFIQGDDGVVIFDALKINKL
jgi:hypothetical protein